MKHNLLRSKSIDLMLTSAVNLHSNMFDPRSVAHPNARKVNDHTMCPSHSLDY